MYLLYLQGKSYAKQETGMQQHLCVLLREAQIQLSKQLFTLVSCLAYSLSLKQR
jgi:hypothetical protein